MIEYLMLAGVNDSADDARELAAWLTGLDVHVNLIPYNPIESAPQWRTTERPERDAFAAILRAAGFTTTIRYSLGADIAAACGQLVQQENRQIARQQAQQSAAARTGSEMMDDIIAGVRTFQRDVYPQYRELFEKLAAGQSPEALVITCSDSRVDPFLFTQAQPGQLFVLRNAGNLVPKYDGIVGGVTATIEFAVVGLQRAEHHRLRPLRLRRDSRPAAPGNARKTCRTWPTG